MDLVMLLDRLDRDNRRQDGFGQRQQHLVVGRFHQQRKKAQGGSATVLSLKRIDLHGSQCSGHIEKLAFVAAESRHLGGLRLHHLAQFEQVAHEGVVDAALELPGQHFGIDQVPASALIHAGAGLRTAGHEAFGGE